MIEEIINNPSLRHSNDRAELFAMPAELQTYIDKVKSSFSLTDLLAYIESVRQLKILVVGETIVDEYHYCETIGKSGKEPILASRFISSDKFAGGVLAIANHLANFSDHVAVLTFLGTANAQQEFIESKLNPSVEKYFLYMEDEPTIIKRRFVENYPMQKLFEIYEMNNCRDNPSCDDRLCSKLSELLPDYDLVLVADYGHGMLDGKAVELLCSEAKFLAVNTQVNAENRGFNTISKYKCADYICISENEIRLEARSRTKEINEIVLQVAEKMHCQKLLLTQGQSGCLIYAGEAGFFKTPAFTQHFVDRIGAGDAVLSITSPLVSLKIPPAMLGVVANAVGALAVAIVGNKEPVNKEDLIKFLKMIYSNKADII